MKVKEFVEKFVGHNSIICIYNHKRVQTKDNGTHDEFVPLWKGMDWQVTENYDDMKYCEQRGFELCPHRNVEVVQIKNFPHDEFSDCVDIIISLSYWNEEEVRKETAKEILIPLRKFLIEKFDYFGTLAKRNEEANSDNRLFDLGEQDMANCTIDRVNALLKEYGIKVEA